MPMAKAPAWTRRELAILDDVFPRVGINGAADALPGRTWRSISVKASRRGLRSPVVGDAPKSKLTGAELEEAIRLREECGWAFARIGATFGVSEAGTCNAVLIALCPRKGFTPAQRDAQGRMTPEGIERLRLALRMGMKPVDIQLRLGLSASRIAEERRRYGADLKARGKAPLPAPGGGEAYSGVKVPRASRQAVETLLLDGFGSKKIGERTGVSQTTIGRIRIRLVKRLARKGEALPGCDPQGRRGAAKESTNYIPAEAIEQLRTLLLDRVPVRRAAMATGIGGSSAYRIRDAFAAELAARGEALPAPKLPGNGSRAEVAKAAWLPADRAHHFRTLAHQHGFEAAKAMVIDEMAAERRAAIDLARRPKTFEEQMAAVRAGARLVDKFIPRMAEPTMTLGGVAPVAI